MALGGADPPPGSGAVVGSYQLRPYQQAAVDAAVGYLTDQTLAGRHGLIVLPTDRTTQVIEGGITDTYALVLTRAPTADVTVDLTALFDQVEFFNDLNERDKELLQHGLLIGRAMTEYKDSFARGDFVIRNLMAVDQESGAIAVTDLVRVGQTVQFHVRDAATADEDLAFLLEPQRQQPPAAGGLLLSCNGRGTRLFEAPCHDITVARSAMPQTPLAGFFAAGFFAAPPAGFAVLPGSFVPDKTVAGSYEGGVLQNRPILVLHARRNRHFDGRSGPRSKRGIGRRDGGLI